MRACRVLAHRNCRTTRKRSVPPLTARAPKVTRVASPPLDLSTVLSCPAGQGSSGFILSPGLLLQNNQSNFTQVRTLGRSTSPDKTCVSSEQGSAGNVHQSRLVGNGAPGLTKGDSTGPWATVGRDRWTMPLCVCTCHSFRA